MKVFLSHCGPDKPAVEQLARALLERGIEGARRILNAAAGELEAIADKRRRLDRLCELNVIDQVQNVARTTIVQDAWRRGDGVQLHGWIYGLKDGLITDLNVSV